MIQLPLKLAEAGVLVIFAVTWEEILLESVNNSQNHVLFGIARKPIGITALRCARRTGFRTFPIERYKGWYSISPVPTVTVVLSLPRMMGTNMLPLLSAGFSS
jgi:hypothetical protein